MALFFQQLGCVDVSGYCLVFLEYVESVLVYCYEWWVFLHAHRQHSKRTIMLRFILIQLIQPQTSPMPYNKLPLLAILPLPLPFPLLTLPSPQKHNLTILLRSIKLQLPT